MLYRKKEKRPGHGRLLDMWVPPNEAGAPIGCVVASESPEDVGKAMEDVLKQREWSPGADAVRAPSSHPL